MSNSQRRRWLFGESLWIALVLAGCSDGAVVHGTGGTSGVMPQTSTSGGQLPAGQGGCPGHATAQSTASTTQQGGSVAASTLNGGGGPLPAQGGSNTSATGTTRPPVTTPSAGFLHVEGSKLLDDEGQSVRLTGVNWFGFETSNLSPHGLWARDYRSMLKQIRELGFNTVRLPWCDAMLAPGAKAASVNTDGADPYDNSTPMNEPLLGKTPLEILDLVVETAGELGLKLILDNHSRKPDGYMEEKVWYTDTVSEEQWIANWVFMADRYRGNPTVIGFDLDNEPHGEASWAAGNAATDWDAAAERCGNAILAANPDALIIVEGVEKVGSDGYWWGGNLSGARANPIELTRPEKLVYSAHEYGPEVFAQKWFTEAGFPDNLPEVWNRKFGFLMKENLGHVFIGEFGIKDPDAAEGTAGTWFKSFLEYAGTDFSFTFWCWNPNSGDTEGILEYDWLTPKQWKLDALKPYLSSQFK